MDTNVQPFSLFFRQSVPLVMGFFFKSLVTTPGLSFDPSPSLYSTVDPFSVSVVPLRSSLGPSVPCRKVFTQPSLNLVGPSLLHHVPQGKFVVGRVRRLGRFATGSRRLGGSSLKGNHWEPDGCYRNLTRVRVKDG